MNVNCYIIEDNYFQMKDLKKMLHKVLSRDPFLNVNFVLVENLTYFYQHLPEMSVPENALFFIDIDLSLYFTGIDVASRIVQHFNGATIIFTTAHKEKAVQAINSHARPFAYLIKQTDSQRMQAELQMITDRLMTILKKKSCTDLVLVVRVGQEEILLPQREICYLSSIKRDRHHVLIQTLTKQLICSGTLTFFKSKLTDSCFSKDFKSFIINSANITKINRASSAIHFENDILLEVGKKIIDKLRKNYST